MRAPRSRHATPARLIEILLVEPSCFAAVYAVVAVDLFRAACRAAGVRFEMS